jgi:hypothetical protein
LIKTAVSVAALLLLGANPFASDPPARKEGLWVTHSVETKNPGNKRAESTWTTCRSHAFDQQFLKDFNARSPCTVTESVHGNVHESDYVCAVAGVKANRKEVNTYQGDTAIHLESHVTFSPAMNGVTETAQVADDTYVGACPSELQPGDMTNGDGKVHHLWNH